MKNPILLKINCKERSFLYNKGIPKFIYNAMIAVFRDDLVYFDIACDTYYMVLFKKAIN